MTHSVNKIIGRFLACLLLASPVALASPWVGEAAAQQNSGVTETKLSAAQTALFDTPHLANVHAPVTLHYSLSRNGPDAFDDMISIQVDKVNSDGSKDLSFAMLSGPRHRFVPALDHFRGNPLSMIVMERDIDAMHDSIGLSRAFLRNRMRDAFIDASVTDGQTTIPDGTSKPARIVTIEPFRHVERLERIASLQAKRYRFVLSPDLPGGIAQIDIDTPADEALHAPALTETVTFTGAAP